MYRRSVKLLFIFLCFFSSSVFAADVAPLYRDGELLVKFKPGVGAVARRTAYESVASEVERRFRSIKVDHIILPAGLSVEEAIKIYRQNPDVEYAEPNFLVRKASFPNDTYFDLQWGLHNAGQTITGDEGTITGLSGIDIDAPLAWNTTTGSDDIIVAVIDSGVDYNHPDLAENIWTNPGEISGNGIDDDGNGFIDDVRGWNFVSNNNNPMDDDTEGHGTHVAGIIGAVGNNGIGTSGVNWNVKIMPLKFLRADGYGDMTDVIDAIKYAVKMGAKIINASYTYPAYCTKLAVGDITAYALPERDSIKLAQDAGILFVAAAGNDGCNNDNTPVYPASHDQALIDAQGVYHSGLNNIISVAAFDQNGNLASFSNYGPQSVHIAAPGVNIFSTVRTALTGKYSKIQAYDYMSGTSMASPFVAGVAGLIWSQNPSFSYLDIKNAIIDSAIPVSSYANKLISGGRLSAARALNDLYRRLKVTVSGQGRVTSDPAGIDCTDRCSMNVVLGKSVTLTETPAEGYKFVKWTGACTGSSTTCTVTVNRAKSAVAVFRALKQFSLRVTAYKGGVVTSSDDNINCDASAGRVSCMGAAKYVEDTNASLTLTASPTEGYKFIKWTGACTGASTTCSVTMSKSASAVAVFRALKKYSLKVSVYKGGVVTGSDGNINCDATNRGKSCSGALKYVEDAGTTVTLTAASTSPYQFLKWVGCTADSAVPLQCTVTMSGSKAITAKFFK